MKEYRPTLLKNIAERVEDRTIYAEDLFDNLSHGEGINRWELITLHSTYFTKKYPERADNKEHTVVLEELDLHTLRKLDEIVEDWWVGVSD